MTPELAKTLKPKTPPVALPLDGVAIWGDVVAVTTVYVEPVLPIRFVSHTPFTYMTCNEIAGLSYAPHII